MLRRATLCIAWLGLAALPAAAQSSLDDLQQKAIRGAAKAVAPSVVQIETAGGKDVVGFGADGKPILKATGPTTGLAVSPDGYVISSAFNFVNKPSTITVRVPGHPEGYIAEVVATDRARQLTLLKFKTAPIQPLVVPAASPKAEMRVGQTTIALGRTLDPNPGDPPSVSVGIISALGRIWGKAIQTDAKVAPTNYGGPLVDIQGRIQGVLVPLSPSGEDELAGWEWYDSGIGFAIPYEDILAVLPRLKTGTAEKPYLLSRGVLGITVQGTDIYGAEPKVATVAPDSAAARAGIQIGDVVKEIDGKPVNSQAQVLHALGAKYEGDVVSVKVLRGKEEKAFKDVKLGSTQNPHGRSILGILPMRDDPELGVEVRYVYPKGPADAAGLKAGDRIMKVGPETGALAPFSGPDQLAAIVSNAIPGTKFKIEVQRKDKKTETLTVTLGELPKKGSEDEVPDALPEDASKKRALEPRKQVPMQGGKPMKPAEPAPAAPKKDDKKPETGILQHKNAAGTHSYWVYVPRNYDPNQSYALVIWLHPLGKDKEKDDDDIQDAWIDYCRNNNIIMAGPHAENKTGWVPSESDVIAEVARDVMATYTIDHRRVIIHGMGVGGQLALYMAFHNRDLVRGVAVTGAALTGQAKEKVPNQPLAFFLHVGGKDPVKDGVIDSRTKLIEQKYPVVYREEKDAGSQYLEDKALDELVRWIDSLDRI
jgi:S1-C subfamily serine protease/dienelactone hydrolase